METKVQKSCKNCRYMVAGYGDKTYCSHPSFLQWEGKISFFPNTKNALVVCKLFEWYPNLATHIRIDLNKFKEWLDARIHSIMAR